MAEVRKDRKKILIVDDDADLLTVMAATLAFGGFDVIQASGGKEAISLAKSEKPDLILLDIRMPVMDGVKTTDVLRSMDETREIPIAYLSNLVEERQVVEGHVLGSKIGDLFFIPKTYPSEKIIKIVNKVLDNNKR